MDIPSKMADGEAALARVGETGRIVLSDRSAETGAAEGDAASGCDMLNVEMVEAIVGDAGEDPRSARLGESIARVASGWWGTGDAKRD